MKTAKIYLAVASILLILALAMGVYVWYLLQTLNVPTAVPTSDTPEQEQTVGTTTGDTKAPIVIETATLPEAQQKALETFGFNGETITITPTMIVCAEAAVGKTRIDQIIAGATPSPLEAIKLLPCFKK